MTVLRPGDLVVLKSGGPVMTVDTVNTDIFDDDKVTGVLCAWFVGNRLERARFDRDAIAPAPLQGGACEKTEPRPPEPAGEYRAVMDEMVAAMNDATEASQGGSQAPITSPKRRSRPKNAAETTAPAARDIN
jgi:uncharacterized protein YodC (DUF2158 family)